MKIKQNIGEMERMVRMGIGILFALLVVTALATKGIALGMAIVGAIAFLTGVSGYCPLYYLMGVDTSRRAGGGTRSIRH
ncbi:MAG TPA: DUF2892 domain-containing protein [Nitrospiria bacterium]|nr:DUF2892 domain-containing protein [Nitrospiria bacterium]